MWKKDREIRLPNREFELLRFMAENPNIVFSKEELFEKIWGYDYISDGGHGVGTHQPAQGKNRGRRQKSQDHRNRLGGRLPAEPVTEGKFPAWETGRPLPMQGH